MTDDKKVDTAVALNYDGKSAPKITASGINDVAEEIVRIAKENNVHLHDDPVLSRMLSTLEIGTEIPRELYLLIAEVIAFAYYLEGKEPSNWTPPEPPDYTPPPVLENKSSRD
ncbi:MAG: flagellar biosynthesis protein FlhB [Gammaproteobacteria bacterium]|nr:MAG: flagellar biosynthesis protein FlhB [Gammaproteobacteria bacterium]